jgi:hypothetical protein
MTGLLTRPALRPLMLLRLPLSTVRTSCWQVSSMLLWMPWPLLLKRPGLLLPTAPALMILPE